MSRLVEFLAGALCLAVGFLILPLATAIIVLKLIVGAILLFFGLVTSISALSR